MNDDERRKSNRHMHDDQVIVKMTASPAGDSPWDESWTCRSDDVSATGLRLSLESEVKAGSLVDVCVISRSRTQTLLMSGVVRWCSRIQGLEYFQIGVDLDMAKSRDAAEWPAFIASMNQG